MIKYLFPISRLYRDVEKELRFLLSEFLEPLLVNKYFNEIGLSLNAAFKSYLIYHFILLPFVLVVFSSSEFALKKKNTEKPRHKVLIFDSCHQTCAEVACDATFYSRF